MWQTFIPAYQDRVIVNSRDDLVFLGKQNLSVLLDHWHQERFAWATRIARIVDLQTLISNNNFAQMSLSYTMPANMTTNENFIYDGSDPEPTDEASKLRESDSATYKVCGWCRHMRDYSGRYGYKIAGTCEFLTDAGLPDNGRVIPAEEFEEASVFVARVIKCKTNSVEEIVALMDLMAKWPGIDEMIIGYRQNVKKTADDDVLTAGLKGTVRRFYTPCFMTRAGVEQLVNIVNKMEQYKKQLESELEKIEQRILTLDEMILVAENKPYFLSWRPYDWSKIGDRVMVYVAGKAGMADRWQEGYVIDGYRYQDCLVHIETDDLLNGGRETWKVGSVSPYVLFREDWQYLKTDSKFRALWLREIDPSIIDDKNKLERILFS